MPDLLVLGSAWLTGLLGSVHCAAMCGGIATGFSMAGAPRVRAMPGGIPGTLPGAACLTASQGWLQALQPNLGRVTGYVLAGALAGALGQGLVELARSERLALTLRALTGLVLVALALRLMLRGRRLAFLQAPGRPLWTLLRPLHRHVLPANTGARRFAAGLLWGWLPCGLSGTVLTLAWLRGDATEGALILLAFGLGNLPAMTSLTWSGARLGQRLQRPGWRHALGGAVFAAGLVTLAAPWLVHLPRLQGLLRVLGCHTGA